MTVPADNEQSEKATTTDEAKPPAGAEDKAQTGGFDRAKALELVAAARQDRQPAASDAAPAKPAESETGETDEKSAAPKEAEGDTASKGDEKDEEESRVFTAEDFEKPGFFDRLSKEEWKALEKQQPVMVRMYRATQGDMTRRGQKLAERERAFKEQSEKKTSTKPAENDDDADKELEELGFTPAEAKKLLSSKIGRSVIREEARSLLREEMNINPERTTAQQDGLGMAMKAYPQMADEEVWLAVQRELEADPEELEELERTDNPRTIARILKAAAAKAVAEHDSKAREKSAKESAKLQKETKNATQPASKAAGAPRRTGAPTSTANMTQTEQMREFVRAERTRKGYKNL